MQQNEYSIDFDVCGGVRNKAGQELRIETKDDNIVFVVINGEERAEFIVTYNNKIIMEDIKKQFVACESHISKIHNMNLKKSFGGIVSP